MLFFNSMLLLKIWLLKALQTRKMTGLQEPSCPLQNYNTTGIADLIATEKHMCTHLTFKGCLWIYGHFTRAVSGQKKNMCVYCHMLKKIRDGRSEMIFFLFYFLLLKMAALASDWLRHFRLLLWNRWTEFNETWQEARSQCPLPSLCYLGRSEKQDGQPGLWLVETFLTSTRKPVNRIQRIFTGSYSTSSTKFGFFGWIGKTRWLPCPLIGWDIIEFFSETV